MFTKKDIKNQLEKLRSLEVAMDLHYTQMSKEMKTAKYKEIFKRLSMEEKEHETEFDQLLKLLEHWKE